MNININQSIKLSRLLPVLFGFFIMGFVDVVNISTSYVKADFSLNDKLANLLPMMVLLWFAILSLPTGILMGCIGRHFRCKQPAGQPLCSACRPGLYPCISLLCDTQLKN